MPDSRYSLSGEVVTTCLCGCGVSTLLGDVGVALEAVISEPERRSWDLFGRYEVPEFLFCKVSIDGESWRSPHRFRIVIDNPHAVAVINEVGWDQQARCLRTYPDENGTHYSIRATDPLADSPPSG